MLSDGHPLLSARVVMCDFLDTSECAEIVRRVNGLRDRWTKRAEGFFTLGAVSYLDDKESRERFLAAAAQTNSLLSDAFDDLYSRLVEFLASVLDEPVGYGERLALPGFHIFEFSSEPSETSGPQDGPPTDLADHTAPNRAHVDLQFHRAVPDSTPEATVSFTLPLEQPSGGAGLAVWPIDYAEVDRRNLSPAEIVDFAAHNPYEQVNYVTGRMILHDGLKLHAAMGGDRTSTGQRITLQGHGVRCQEQWTLYW